MIAAPHSQQDPRVMRKVVCQSINRVSRQANSEVTSNHLRIFYNTPNLIQTPPRNFGIDMHKPQHIATRNTCAYVHLRSSIGSGPNELIAKARAEISCAIDASAVCHNNLRTWRSVTQVPKKWANEYRLVKDR